MAPVVSASRANSLANLRPWQPEDRTYRGNPKRNPLRHYIRQQTLDGREMADFMLGVLRGEPILKSRLAKRDRIPSLKARMYAAEWLADRAFGRPKESVEITEGDGTRAERRTLIAAMSPEDREALMALLRRAIEAQTPAPPPAGLLGGS